DNPKMLEEYKPAQISKADYNFVQENVPTIAVQAVMVSYDFSQSGSKKRCEKLSSLSRLLRKELPTLKEKGHPKWKEVNLDADPGKALAGLGWRRSTSSQDRVWENSEIESVFGLPHEFWLAICSTRCGRCRC
ncbi:MAG: hypothetical protein WCH40_12440, partial [Verrucomicrobiales bacterium]